VTTDIENHTVRELAGSSCDFALTDLPNLAGLQNIATAGNGWA